MICVLGFFLAVNMAVVHRKPRAFVPGRRSATRQVTLNLDARVQLLGRPAHKWTIDPGKFVVLVGDSSENTPLHAEVTLN